MMTGNTLYRPTAALLLGVAVLLMVPLLAMQVTDEVVWGPFDFVVAGALLFGTGFAFLLASRRGRGLEYRLGAGLGLAAAFLLVWLNLAVGIIGSEDNPANAMYLGVLAIAIVGSIAARSRPRGMARAMFGAALAVAVVGAIAVIFRLGAPENGALQLIALNGFFAALFAGSALLFHRAAQEGPVREPGR